MHPTPRSAPRPRLLRHALAALLVGTVALGASATGAAAAPTTTDPFGDSIFTDLSLGNTADDVGDIYVKRVADDDGSGEVLLVRIDVISPGEIAESSVCVEDEAFTDRDLGEGGCAGIFVQQDNDGASFAQYEVDLGDSLVGDPIFVQIHTTLTNGQLGGTAFGGWLPGDPFYGNIPVPPLAVTCPADMEHVDGNDNGLVDDGECLPPCDEGETRDAAGDCSAPAVFECPAGMTGSDANANGVVDPGECSAPAVFECPAGMTGSDANANGVVDPGECSAPAVFECPAGMTGSDANANGVVDPGECSVPQVLPEVIVPATCAAGTTHVDHNLDQDVDPGECIVPCNANETLTQAGTCTPRVLAAAGSTANPTEVAGVQQARPAQQLPRTGSDGGPIELGMVLILGGVVLQRLGKQRTALR